LRQNHLTRIVDHKFARTYSCTEDDLLYYRYIGTSVLEMIITDFIGTVVF